MKNKLMLSLAVSTLLLIAVGGALCQKETEKICRETKTLISAAVEAAENGGTDTSLACAERLAEYWRGKQRFLTLFYENGTHSSIGEGIDRLKIYAGMESLESLRAEAETVSSRLDALADYDALVWTNLF